MPSLCQPGGAGAHAENARSLLIITPGHSIGVRQLGAHSGIVLPVDLVGVARIDGPWLNQGMCGLILAHGRCLPIAAHGALPPAGVETVKGRQKGIAAHVGAEALDIAMAGKPHECPRKHPEAASWCCHVSGSCAQVLRDFSTLWP